MLLKNNEPVLVNIDIVMDSFVMIETPIGIMVAVAEESLLLALFFIDETRKDEWVEQLSVTAKQQTNPVLELVKAELAEYFAGTLKVFTVRTAHASHTKFFSQALECVKSIEYGTTKSYGQVAKDLGNPKAYRAVGEANKSNVIIIVVPCHRVLCADGSLGGYSQGLDRKVWLLNHERKFVNT